MIQKNQLTNRNVALLSRSKDGEIQRTCYLCGQLGEKDFNRLDKQASNEWRIRVELPYDWRFNTIEEWIQRVKENSVEPEILTILGRIRDVDLQLEVALSDTAPSEVLKFLSEGSNHDYSSKVDEAVRILRYAPKDLQRKDRHLNLDFDEFIKTSGVDKRLLEGLAESPYWSDRVNVALSKSCCSALRQKLTSDRNSLVRFAALHAYRLPFEMRYFNEAEYLRLLYESPDNAIIDILSHSPSFKVRELVGLIKEKKSLPAPNQRGESSDVMLWWDCTNLQHDRALNIALAYKILNDSSITLYFRGRTQSFFGLITISELGLIYAYRFDDFDSTGTCLDNVLSFKFPGAALPDLGVVDLVQTQLQGSLTVGANIMAGLAACEKAVEQVCYLGDKQYYIHDDLAKAYLSDEQKCSYMSVWFNPWVFQVAKHLGPETSVMELLPEGSLDFFGMTVYY